MSTVREILAIKGTQVLSVGPSASVLDAALLMNEHKIGGLVVTEGGQICGIITERDILQKIVGQRRDPGQTPVREVMTADVLCCQPFTPLEELRGVMKHRRIRHVPVVENNQLCGLISIGDLNAFETSSQEQTIHLLHAYIHGRV